MSVSVSAVGRLVANISQPRIWLLSTVGGFELAFAVQGVSVPRIGEQAVIWLAPDLARISIGTGVRDLGTARPNHSLRVRTLNSPLPMDYEFRLPLSASQLGAVEECRAGGDLAFRIVISGVAGSENDLTQRETFQVVLTRTVPQSEWIQHLRSVKAAEILLLEVPMPFVDPPEKAAAVTNLLRQAQTHFLSAHYTDSVINCRKAIEALESLIERDRAGLLRKLATDREGLTKDQRRTTIEAALYHFGSLAAHDAAIAFDRRDAKLALALTSALISYELN